MRKLWHKLGWIAAGVAAFEAGARIVAPGLNGQVLREYLASGGTGLLGLYDLLTGGGLSRGAVLALGVVPYVSARIFVRLARIVSPSLNAISQTDEGHRMLTRLTRGVTVGLALVQSYGFARFVLGVPGVVANPGTGFVIQTMIVLTGSSLVAMLISERISQKILDDGQAAANQPDAPQLPELRATYDVRTVQTSGSGSVTPAAAQLAAGNSVPGEFRVPARDSAPVLARPNDNE